MKRIGWWPAVECTHEWSEDVMADLFCNKCGRRLKGWSHACLARRGLLFYQSTNVGRNAGATYTTELVVLCEKCLADVTAEAQCDPLVAAYTSREEDSGVD